MCDQTVFRGRGSSSRSRLTAASNSVAVHSGDGVCHEHAEPEEMIRVAFQVSLLLGSILCPIVQEINLI